MANRLVSENAALAGDGRALTRDDNKPPSVVDLLTSELSETYAKEFDKVDPIRERANAREQKIASDEDLAAWTAIYVDANTLWKALDGARKNEARPLDAAIKNVFEPKLQPLATILTWIKTKADDYNRAKLKKQREDEAAEQARLRKIVDDERREAEIAAEFQDTDAAIEHVTRAAAVQQQAAQAPVAKAADVARVRNDNGGMATAATVWTYAIDDYSKVDLNALRLIIDRKAVETAIAKVVKNQKGETKIDGVRVYEDVGTKFRA